MFPYPKLVIVGRPNVGKSALFNRICGRRIAIVDEAEGVTRDRIYADAEFFGRNFCLVDTGGIDPKSKALFSQEVRRQSQIAIEEGEVIVMVVDARIGVTQLDLDLSRQLLRLKKPLYLAVNKIDNVSQEYLIQEFHNLGIKHMIGVSAVQGYNIAELLEMVSVDLFENAKSEEDTDKKAEQTVKVAFIGRPNVGKSTLLNQIIQEDRSVVSPIAGTTRDNIDVDIECNGKQYRLIDTAGIRRKHAEHEVVDKFAAIRTQQAIERTDVALLMVDAVVGITVQDKKIANTIEEAGKGCIVIFNKWDLVKGFRMEHCKQAAYKEVPFLQHCPMLFISAATGRNVNQIFHSIDEVYAAVMQKIPTGQLNRFIMSILQKRHPPMIQGRRLRIYYLTQVGVQPSRFVLFVNHIELMEGSYLRFLQNQMRAHFSLTGVPLVLKLRGKKVQKRKEKRETALQDSAVFIKKHADDFLSEEVDDEGDYYDDDFSDDTEEKTFQ